MPRIESVEFGEILIGGKTYYSDVVVWKEGKPGLLPKTHLVDLNLLRQLLKKKPDCVVIGVGLRGTVKILPEVRELLEGRRTALFLDRTENALQIYNGLLCLGRNPAGIMHVTL